MESSLRKNLLKEAARLQVERHGLLGGGLLLGAAAFLTALTTPWLAPVWLAGAAAGGVGVSLSAARALLNPGSGAGTGKEDCVTLPRPARGTRGVASVCAAGGRVRY
jgi:hypothetical protein